MEILRDIEIGVRSKKRLPSFTACPVFIVSLHIPFRAGGVCVYSYVVWDIGYYKLGFWNVIPLIILEIVVIQPQDSFFLRNIRFHALFLHKSRLLSYRHNLLRPHRCKIPVRAGEWVSQNPALRVAADGDEISIRMYVLHFR